MTEYLVTTHGGGAILMKRRPARIVRGSSRYSAHRCSDMAGLDGASSQELASKIENLTSAIKEEMIKTAAAQMAVNITLMIALNSYPIVGNALSALLAVTTSLGARYNKNKMSDLMDDLSSRLNGLASAARTEVSAAGMQAVREETPAAAALALSGQPLDGLGFDLLDTIKTAWNQGRRELGSAAGKVVTLGAKYNPMVFGARTALNVVGKGASAVGLDQVSNVTDKAGSAIDTATDKTGDKAGQWVEDPLVIGKDVQTVALTATGYEAVKQADQKSGEVYAVAAAQIAEAKTKALAEMQLPAFRAELRKKIAQKMLEDPAFAAQAAAAGSSNTAMKRAFASKSSLGSVAVGVGSVVLLGVAAYFLFKKSKH